MLQERTFYGKEKKSLAYVIAIMNMILHGIDAPNVVHTNTLAESINDIQEKNRFDVILANPPFGGKERPEVQQNFDIRTGETAFLFLQHFIKSLRAGGRAAFKNTSLSNGDNARRLLAQGIARKLQLAHGARSAGRDVSGRGREDGGSVFRQGRADTKNLVLSTRPRPQPRQDQPAERRRSQGVRGVAGEFR